MPASDETSPTSKIGATTLPARVLERVMLVALSFAVALMLSGVALSLLRGESPRHTIAIQSLPEGLSRGDPAAYLSLGLVMLIATPALRVLGSLVVFALQRDLRYVLVTAVILGLMAVGFILGQA